MCRPRTGGHPFKYWPSGKLLDLGDRHAPDTYHTPNTVGTFVKLISFILVSITKKQNLQWFFSRFRWNANVPCQINFFFFQKFFFYSKNFFFQILFPKFSFSNFFYITYIATLFLIQLCVTRWKITNFTRAIARIRIRPFQLKLGEKV